MEPYEATWAYWEEQGIDINDHVAIKKMAHMHLVVMHNVQQVYGKLTDGVIHDPATPADVAINAITSCLTHHMQQQPRVLDDEHESDDDYAARLIASLHDRTDDDEFTLSL